MRTFKSDEIFKLKTNTSGIVPEGASYIAFYSSGPGATVDGEEIPPGGYTMPELSDRYYEQVPYNANGNDLFIRAFYRSPFQVP